MAKQKAYEKQAKKKRIKLDELCVFTNQLASMLEAGLPLVSAMEALQEQTDNPVFQIIIRNVRIDVSSGTAFSEAVRKFPNAFPNLFMSMVEASDGLAGILAKVAIYFENTVALMKKVKGAMTYPVSVIVLAVGLVNVLLVFVIPVFADMFADFFETEIDTTVDALTSLMEPVLICFLGVIIGGIVMAMFLPIFQLSSVVSG